MRSITLIVGALLAAGTLSASVIVEKDDNAAGVYTPIATGDYAYAHSYVYADSFVFTGDPLTELDTLGVWLLGGSGTSQIQFELLADNSGPDGSDVLASSAVLTFDLSSLTLETASVTPYVLTPGQTYWVAVSSVGLSGDGFYQVGQHQQNSEGINDNGTFWASNDSGGIVFNGLQSATPEMAIYASGSEVTPEPRTWVLCVAGCALFAVGRRRNQ